MKKQFQFYLWTGAVWLALWVFGSFLYSPEIFFLQSLNEVWRVVYLVSVNFIFFEYGLPFFLKKRTSVIYYVFIGVPLITVLFSVLSLGLYLWQLLGTQLHIYTFLRQASLDPGGRCYYVIDEALYQLQGGIASLFFFGIAKLFYDNFKLKQTAQKLRLEKQEAELNYIKSQTNPHFLFNTLNNIYSLARDKSELAPESILRLSKILRFMLYETSGEFIRVEQELEIISDYIALEKIRYDDSLRISFNYEIENMKEPLPPLLLVPFVENAFKHGISETINNPFLDIRLTVNKQQLLFSVNNSAKSIAGEKNVKENIGLYNLRRQLELLYTDYSLTVGQKETVFTATLKVNLASHV